MRVLVVGFAVVFSWLLRRVFVTNDLTIVGDGQVSIRYWEVARTAVARGDGFPLWDRSQCAGYPFIGNPETGLVSSLVAGVFRVHGDSMERWYPVVGGAIGLLGLYAWCRRVLLLGRIPSLYAGALWIAGGFLSTHFAGHMTFVPFACIPWVLLLARLGEDDLRAAVLCGGVLALMAIEGGTYPVPYAILALAIAEGPRVLRKGGALSVLRLTAVVALTFFLLAGIKLYPELAQLSRHPRHFDETDTIAWTELFPMLLDKDRFGAFAGHHYVWDEYRSYIGPLAFGMAIAGALRALS